MADRVIQKRSRSSQTTTTQQTPERFQFSGGSQSLGQIRREEDIARVQFEREQLQVEKEQALANSRQIIVEGREEAQRIRELGGTRSSPRASQAIRRAKIASQKSRQRAQQIDRLIRALKTRESTLRGAQAKGISISQQEQIERSARQQQKREISETKLKEIEAEKRAFEQQQGRLSDEELFERNVRDKAESGVGDFQDVEGNVFSVETQTVVQEGIATGPDRNFTPAEPEKFAIIGGDKNYTPVPFQAIPDENYTPEAGFSTAEGAVTFQRVPDPSVLRLPTFKEQFTEDVRKGRRLERRALSDPVAAQELAGLTLSAPIRFAGLGAEKLSRGARANEGSTFGTQIALGGEDLGREARTKPENIVIKYTIGRGLGVGIGAGAGVVTRGVAASKGVGAAITTQRVIQVGGLSAIGGSFVFAPRQTVAAAPELVGGVSGFSSGFRSVVPKPTLTLGSSRGETSFKIDTRRVSGFGQEQRTGTLKTFGQTFPATQETQVVFTGGRIANKPVFSVEAQQVTLLSSRGLPKGQLSSSSTLRGGFDAKRGVLTLRDDSGLVFTSRSGGPLVSDQALFTSSVATESVLVRDNKIISQTRGGFEATSLPAARQEFRFADVLDVSGKGVRFVKKTPETRPLRVVGAEITGFGESKSSFVRQPKSARRVVAAGERVAGVVAGENVTLRQGKGLRGLFGSRSGSLRGRLKPLEPESVLDPSQSRSPSLSGLGRSPSLAGRSFVGGLPLSRSRSGTSSLSRFGSRGDSRRAFEFESLPKSDTDVLSRFRPGTASGSGQRSGTDSRSRQRSSFRPTRPGRPFAPTVPSRLDIPVDTPGATGFLGGFDFFPTRGKKGKGGGLTSDSRVSRTFFETELGLGGAFAASPGRFGFTGLELVRSTNKKKKRRKKNAKV